MRLYNITPEALLAPLNAITRFNVSTEDKRIVNGHWLVPEAFTREELLRQNSLIPREINGLKSNIEHGYFRIDNQNFPANQEPEIFWQQQADNFSFEELALKLTNIRGCLAILLMRNNTMFSVRHDPLLEQPGALNFFSRNTPYLLEATINGLTAYDPEDPEMRHQRIPGSFVIRCEITPGEPVHVVDVSASNSALHFLLTHNNVSYEHFLELALYAEAEEEFLRLFDDYANDEEFIHVLRGFLLAIIAQLLASANAENPFSTHTEALRQFDTRDDILNYLHLNTPRLTGRQHVAAILTELGVWRHTTSNRLAEDTWQENPDDQHEPQSPVNR